MAAIQLRTARTSTVRRWRRPSTSKLPPYAVPLFVRVAESLEHTSTFKSQKVDLRKQATGRRHRRDPLYVLAGRDEGYVEFYEDYADEVADGKRPRG